MEKTKKRLLKKIPIGEEQAEHIAQTLEELGIRGTMLISIDLEEDWGYAVKLIAGGKSYYLTMDRDGDMLAVRKGNIHGEILRTSFLDTIIFDDE